MKRAKWVAVMVIAVLALMLDVGGMGSLPAVEAQTVTTDLSGWKKATGFKLVKPDRIDYGVSGAICVKNEGKAATQNLTIVDTAQYAVEGGPFQDIPGAIMIFTPPQLQPGESKCYQYDFRFTPPPGAFKYQNKAAVTITNYTGRLGVPFGPVFYAPFVLP